MKCFLLVCCLCVSSIGCVWAEPLNRLTLTNAEMQKLKRYFPVEESASAPVKINTLSPIVSGNSPSHESVMTTEIAIPPEKAVSEVDLLRFAFQTLYAPSDIRHTLPFYARAPLHSTPFVTGLIRQTGVIAHPLASWTAGGHYVTAVALQNSSPYRIVLHRETDFCGQWQGAVLYPRAILQSHGNTLRDQTMLFVLSDQPFGEALAVCHGNV
jgi:hypothetical protein